MLLPQTATKSKADSSLSISMHLSTPEPVRNRPASGPTIRILAGGLAMAALASDAHAFSETMPVGEAVFAVGVAGQSWTAFTDWIAASYARAPALVLGLAALIARERGVRFGPITVHTDAGTKRLHLLEVDPRRRYLFRADMGAPTDLQQRTLEVAGERIDVVTMRVGNPQCVLLAPLDEARLHRLGAALQRHEAFPDAVNFEIAQVEPPDVVSILIWERGVGPTQSSGTGSCAAAVAAMVAGGAARRVRVRAPGGEQVVEWPEEDHLFLTGWAEVVFDGEWLG